MKTVYRTKARAEEVSSKMEKKSGKQHWVVPEFGNCFQVVDKDPDIKEEESPILLTHREKMALSISMLANNFRFRRTR